MGFDHIALAAGAGKPTVLDMPNGLARGVRTASDFLMGLQLTGAARTDSDRQPAGAPADRGRGRRPHGDRHRHRIARVLPRAGGEIPRALREARARAQRRRSAQRLERGRDRRRRGIPHARRTRSAPSARPRAREGRAPRILELLQSWGGSTIAYRKRLIDSPSYTLNHEEVEKALEEGIRFAEGLTPRRGRRSIASGTPRALARRPSRRAASCRRARSSSPRARSPIRCSRARTPTISCSTGATSAPSTRTARRSRPSAPPSRRAVRVLMSRDAEERFVSFFGDLHPSFFGNVVKAMGSAKQGYPVVSRVLERRPARADGRDARLSSRA